MVLFSITPKSVLFKIYEYLKKIRYWWQEDQFLEQTDDLDAVAPGNKLNYEKTTFTRIQFSKLECKFIRFHYFCFF